MYDNTTSLTKPAVTIPDLANLFIGGVYLLVLVLMIIAMWRVFFKAGKPGWAALIPLYNIYVLCQIVGRPGVWTLLACIPIMGIVINLILALDLAKSFGKSNAFGALLLWLFGIIGYPMLAFGSATYRGPSVGQSAPRSV
jgi:hypothetical protein